MNNGHLMSAKDTLDINDWNNYCPGITGIYDACATATTDRNAFESCCVAFCKKTCKAKDIGSCVSSCSDISMKGPGSKPASFGMAINQEESLLSNRTIMIGLAIMLICTVLYRIRRRRVRSY